MKKTLILLCLLIVAVIPALVGILHPGFFATDDGNWMVIRLSAFYEALRQGQFPVRFLPRLNNRFGYPVADFLYPLFLYVGSVIHIFHIPFVLTVKLLFALSLLGSAVGSFVWLRKRCGDIAGFIGSVLYTLFPYHIWDITKRGSLGEVLALGVAPFIFWQIEEGNIFFIGLGLGLLIVAHNTLALLFLPVILGYMVLLREFRKMILATLLGLGLSAFFWFPALYDKQFTVFDMTTVSNFSQYFLSGNLYPLIGIVSFVVLLLSLFLLFKKPEDRPAYFLVVTFLSLSLTTQVSTSIWQLFHLGTYVQFPFRFLSITTLGVSFLAAYVIGNWKKLQRSVIAGLLFVLIYVSSWQYFLPHVYQFYPDTFYSTNQDTTTVQAEYMPIWVKQLPSTKPEIHSTVGHIHTLDMTGSKISFLTRTATPAAVMIPTVYFPGWTATINGKKTTITPQKGTGFITVHVGKGTHIVDVSFTETSLRLIADIVSLLSILILVGFIVLPFVKKKGKHAKH